MKIERGAYVIATKYSDGSFMDQWAIGFYDQEQVNRHFVLNADGQQFRASGFRKVKKITKEEGDFLKDNIPSFPSRKQNIWTLLRDFRNKS